MGTRGTETRVTLGVEATYGAGVKAEAGKPIDFTAWGLVRDLVRRNSEACRGRAGAANALTVADKVPPADVGLEIMPEKGLCELLLSACGMVQTIQGIFHTRELIGFSDGADVSFAPANTRTAEGELLAAATPADDLTMDTQPANNMRIKLTFTASGANVEGTATINGTMNGITGQSEVIDISVADGQTGIYHTQNMFENITTLDCLDCDDGTATVTVDEVRTRVFLDMVEQNYTDWVTSGTGAITVGTAPTAAELRAAVTPADDLSLTTQPSKNARLVLKVIAGDSTVAGDVYITGTADGVATTMDTVAVSQLTGTTTYYVTNYWFSAVDASGIDALEINDGTGTTIAILQAQDVHADYEETVSGVYSHKFLDNSGVKNRVLPSLIAYVDKRVKAERIRGINVNTVSFAGAPDDVFKGTFGLVGKDLTDDGITYPTGLSYGQTAAGADLDAFEFNLLGFYFLDGSYQRQWAQDNNVETVTFGFDNGGETKSTANGSRNITKFSPGIRVPTLTYGLEEEDTLWYNRYTSEDSLLFKLDVALTQLIGVTVEYYRFQFITYKSYIQSDSDPISGQAALLMSNIATGNLVDTANEDHAFAFIVTNAQAIVNTMFL